jgi:hypothetical protein
MSGYTEIDRWDENGRRRSYPVPPTGSEHYREGWRNGYEQAQMDAAAPAPVDVPARLRAAAEVADAMGKPGAAMSLRDLAAALVIYPPDVVEAIGRALTEEPR